MLFSDSAWHMRYSQNIRSCQKSLLVFNLVSCVLFLTDWNGLCKVRERRKKTFPKCSNMHVSWLGDFLIFILFFCCCFWKLPISERYLFWQTSAKNPIYLTCSVVESTRHPKVWGISCHADSPWCLQVPQLPRQGRCMARALDATMVHHLPIGNS